MIISSRSFEVFRKIFGYFRFYPKVSVLRPKTLEQLFGFKCNSSAGRTVVAMQSVVDPYYFFLFASIAATLRSLTALDVHLLGVGFVNGAIGTGFWVEIKRSPLLSWLRLSPWTRAYGRFVDRVGYRQSTLGPLIEEIRNWQQSKSLWHEAINSDRKFTLIINGIVVDDLIIDSYMRFRPNYRFDVRDKFVRQLIWQALREVSKAERYFNVVRPKWYLTSYTSYLEHGIPARVALKAGVSVWSFANLNQPGKLMTNNDVYHSLDFSNYRSEFESLPNQAERLEKAEQSLGVRLSGGVDGATVYMRRSAYASDGSVVPPEFDGAVVVFLHDFFDSPHVYPDLVFDDFWSWVTFTIERLQIEGINFYLKPHPNQIKLSSQVLDRIRNIYPNVNWLPSGISNRQLVDAGLGCGITVYGTVAHELAYLGVHSLCCARHPHHSFEFCRTAKTKEEYAELIRNAKICPLGKDEMRRQALAFYYMHNLNTTSRFAPLHSAYLDLWTACSDSPVESDRVKRSVRNLTCLTAFAEFVRELHVSAMV